MTPLEEAEYLLAYHQLEECMYAYCAKCERLEREVRKLKEKEPE